MIKQMCWLPVTEADYATYNSLRLKAILDHRDLKGALWLTTANVIKTPRFNKNQMVCFVGGVGKIRSCRPESGTWTYVVEKGPEPDMGRVGSETMILLLKQTFMR